MSKLAIPSPTSHLNRRRLLRAGGATGLGLALGSHLAQRTAAQEITFSRDYEGTTLNLLMEDLLETTIIENMLPEFEELTGITVQFEKVVYGVMHEKLVPQLAAGPGNGTYDVLEVDFYWVYEFARSGWVEEFGRADRRERRRDRPRPVRAGDAGHRLPGRRQDLLRPLLRLPDGTHLPRRPARRSGVPGGVPCRQRTGHGAARQR